MKNACIHPAYLRKLVTRFVADGHDPDVLLAQAKFSWESLQHRESMLSLDQARSVLIACQEVAQSPTLGIEEGRAVQMADHGLLGWLMSSAANLREAMQALNKFSSLRTGIWTDLLLFDDKGAWIVVEPAFPLGDVKALLLDHFAGVMSRIFASISNGPLDLVRYEVPWAPPAWRNAYHAVAGTVVFNAERPAFWLPDEMLDKPNPIASRLDFREAWELCETKLKLVNETKTLGAKLRHLLERTDTDWTDKVALAARVGVSPTTLFRYLRREGVTFSQVKDEVRQKRALWYLEYSTLSIAEIACTLGYATESNFSRAFRRWMGMAPFVYRKIKQHRSAAE